MSINFSLPGVQCRQRPFNIGVLDRDDPATPNLAIHPHHTRDSCYNFLPANIKFQLIIYHDF